MTVEVHIWETAGTIEKETGQKDRWRLGFRRGDRYFHVESDSLWLVPARRSLRGGGCDEARAGGLHQEVNQMIGMLDTYDWEQAFLYARQPQRVPPGADVDQDAISRDDVASIVWHAEGERDGPNWLIGGQLVDGRWFFLAAGCDYTGWDCQAGGNAYVADGRESIERFAMGDDDRERLGVGPLDGERREINAGW